LTIPIFIGKIIDLNSFVDAALSANKKILPEGAQGTLLSIDYGTTFYQTASDCSVEGLAKGCCLKVSDIDQVLGIVKAPFMTRVGNGPFPTEFGGRESEAYCHDSSHNAVSEKALNIDINQTINYEDDELLQGLAIRIKGREYGATTGRARRTGWLDLIALKHSIKINGPDLVLTKFDVMSGVKKIKLCIGYKYSGPEIFYAGKTLKSGDILTEFIRESEILYHCKPIYKEFPGWDGDITKIRSTTELPDEIKDILIFIQEFTGGRIVILSVGPSSEETIFISDNL
jgi:adenylosuccinate synthase